MNLENIIGEILDGKYRIERQLGKGGMGTVYLATHIGTERPVALKVIASEFMKREEFVERFRREARAAGRLRHPNVVDVTDFGFSATKNGDVAYLVMEYLDGCTLGEILEEEKQLPVFWTVDILEQVCSAVHEAHEQGIIHRDLKPDNIWLEPNQRGGYTVKVLDFGIAKLEETHIITPDDFDDDVLSTSKTQIVDGSETVSDIGRTETIADHKHSTLISESATVSLDNPTRNIDSEAGTIIQSDEISSEDGTKILPANQTQEISSQEDNAATKLISDQIDTDKESEVSDSTAKSLISAPSTSELTRVGAVLGTPLYMSPEQCSGEKLTNQSDVYSMGVIAYQMISGKTPFDGDYTEVMEAHKKVEPKTLKAKGVSKRVKNVIHKSLAKKPLDRPQSAEAFASELRSSSEGFGTLLRRALVIYSERLPKFLLISFLLAIPSIILTIFGVALRFIVAADLISNGVFAGVLSGLVAIATFFIQIFYSALLVGMTTWIVAQKLATPLRPISIRAAFRKVKSRWKPLFGTVTLSTLLSFLGWGVAFTIGGAVGFAIGYPLYLLFGVDLLGIITGGLIGLVIAVILGVGITGFLMLITPSIMMENISGRKAFRRSIELARRSFRTVFATALSVYVIPVVLASIMALIVGGIAKNLYPDEAKPKSAETEQSQGKKEEDNLNISLNGEGLSIQTDKDKEVPKDKSMAKNFRNAVQQGLFELLWSPIIIIMASFTSVITALLYFKTRQAGGETMQELLEQFEEHDQPVSNWQKRVRKKILESGKSTGGRKIVSGS